MSIFEISFTLWNDVNFIFSGREKAQKSGEVDKISARKQSVVEFIVEGSIDRWDTTEKCLSKWLFLLQQSHDAKFLFQKWQLNEVNRYPQEAISRVRFIPKQRLTFYFILRRGQLKVTLQRERFAISLFLIPNFQSQLIGLRSNVWKGTFERKKKQHKDCDWDWEGRQKGLG